MARRYYPKKNYIDEKGQFVWPSSIATPSDMPPIPKDKKGSTSRVDPLMYGKSSYVKSEPTFFHEIVESIKKQEIKEISAQRMAGTYSEGRPTNLYGYFSVDKKATVVTAAIYADKDLRVKIREEKFNISTTKDRYDILKHIKAINRPLPAGEKPIDSALAELIKERTKTGDSAKFNDQRVFTGNAGNLKIGFNAHIYSKGIALGSDMDNPVLAYQAKKLANQAEINKYTSYVDVLKKGNTGANYNTVLANVNNLYESKVKAGLFSNNITNPLHKARVLRNHISDTFHQATMELAQVAMEDPETARQFVLANTELPELQRKFGPLAYKQHFAPANANDLINAKFVLDRMEKFNTQAEKSNRIVHSTLDLLNIYRAVEDPRSIGEFSFDEARAALIKERVEKGLPGDITGNYILDSYSKQIEEMKATIGKQAIGPKNDAQILVSILERESNYGATAKTGHVTDIFNPNERAMKGFDALKTHLFKATDRVDEGIRLETAFVNSLWDYSKLLNIESETIRDINSFIGDKKESLINDINTSIGISENDHTIGALPGTLDDQKLGYQARRQEELLFASEVDKLDEVTSTQQTTDNIEKVAEEVGHTDTGRDAPTAKKVDQANTLFSNTTKQDMTEIVKKFPTMESKLAEIEKLRKTRRPSLTQKNLLSALEVAINHMGGNPESISVIRTSKTDKINLKMLKKNAKNIIDVVDNNVVHDFSEILSDAYYTGDTLKSDEYGTFKVKKTNKLESQIIVDTIHPKHISVSIQQELDDIMTAKFVANNGNIPLNDFIHETIKIAKANQATKTISGVPIIKSGEVKSIISKDAMESLASNIMRITDPEIQNIGSDKKMDRYAAKLSVMSKDLTKLIYNHAQYAVGREMQETVSAANEAFINTLLTDMKAIDLDATILKPGEEGRNVVLSAYDKFIEKFIQTKFKASEAKGVKPINYLYKQLMDQYTSQGIGKRLKISPEAYLKTSLDVLRASEEDKYLYDVGTESQASISKFVNEYHANLNMDGKSNLSWETMRENEDAYFDKVRADEIEDIATKNQTAHLKGTPMAWEEQVSPTTNFMDDADKLYNKKKFVTRIQRNNLDTAALERAASRLSSGTLGVYDELAGNASRGLPHMQNVVRGLVGAHNAQLGQKSAHIDADKAVDLFTDFYKEGLAEPEVHTTALIRSHDFFKTKEAADAFSDITNAMFDADEESLLSVFHEDRPLGRRVAKAIQADVNKLLGREANIFTNDLALAQNVASYSNRRREVMITNRTAQGGIVDSEVEKFLERIGTNKFEARFNANTGKVHIMDPRSPNSTLIVVSEKEMAANIANNSGDFKYVAPLIEEVSTAQQHIELMPGFNASRASAFRWTHGTQEMLKSASVGSMQNLREIITSGKEFTVYDTETSTLPNKAKREMFGLTEISARKAKIVKSGENFVVEDLNKVLQIYVKPNKEVRKFIDKGLKSSTSSNDINEIAGMIIKGKIKSFKVINQIDNANALWILRNYAKYDPALNVPEQEVWLKKIVNADSKFTTQERVSLNRHAKVGMEWLEKFEGDPSKNIPASMTELEAIKKFNEFKKDDVLISQSLQDKVFINTALERQKDEIINKAQSIHDEKINTMKSDLSRLQEEFAQHNRDSVQAQKDHKQALKDANRRSVSKDKAMAEAAKKKGEVYTPLQDRVDAAEERITSSKAKSADVSSRIDKMETAIADLNKANKKAIGKDIRAINKIKTANNKAIDLMHLFYAFFPEKIASKYTIDDATGKKVRTTFGRDIETQLAHFGMKESALLHQSAEDVKVNLEIFQKYLNRMTDKSDPKLMAKAENMLDIIFNPEKYRVEEGSYVAKLSGATEGKNITSGVYKIGKLEKVKGGRVDVSFLSHEGEFLEKIRYDSMLELQHTMSHGYKKVDEKEAFVRAEQIEGDRVRRHLEKATGGDYGSWQRTKENAGWVAGGTYRSEVMDTFAKTEAIYDEAEDVIKKTMGARDKKGNLIHGKEIAHSISNSENIALGHIRETETISSYDKNGEPVTLKNKVDRPLNISLESVERATKDIDSIGLDRAKTLLRKSRTYNINKVLETEVALIEAKKLLEGRISNINAQLEQLNPLRLKEQLTSKLESAKTKLDTIPVTAIEERQELRKEIKAINNRLDPQGLGKKIKTLKKLETTDGEYEAQIKEYKKDLDNVKVTPTKEEKKLVKKLGLQYKKDTFELKNLKYIENTIGTAAEGMKKEYTGIKTSEDLANLLMANKDKIIDKEAKRPRNKYIVEETPKGDKIIREVMKDETTGIKSTSEYSVAAAIDKQLTPIQKDVLLSSKSRNVNTKEYIVKRKERLPEAYPDATMTNVKKRIYTKTAEYMNSAEGQMIEAEKRRAYVINNISQHGYSPDEYKGVIRKMNDAVRDAHKGTNYDWMKSLGDIKMDGVDVPYNLNVDISTSDKARTGIAHILRTTVDDKGKGMSFEKLNTHIAGLGIDTKGVTSEGQLGEVLFHHGKNLPKTDLAYRTPLTDPNEISALQKTMREIADNPIIEKTKNLINKDGDGPFHEKLFEAADARSEEIKGLPSHYVNFKTELPKSIIDKFTTDVITDSDGNITTLENLFKRTEAYKPYDLSEAYDMGKAKFDEWESTNKASARISQGQLKKARKDYEIEVQNTAVNKLAKENRKGIATVTENLLQPGFAVNEDTGLTRDVQVTKKVAGQAWRDIVKVATSDSTMSDKLKKQAMEKLQWLSQDEITEFSSMPDSVKKLKTAEMDAIRIMMRKQIMTEGDYAGLEFGQVPLDKLKDKAHKELLTHDIGGVDELEKLKYRKFKGSHKEGMELRNRVTSYLNTVSDLGMTHIVDQPEISPYLPTPAFVEQDINTAITNLNDKFPGSTTGNLGRGPINTPSGGVPPISVGSHPIGGGPGNAGSNAIALVEESTSKAEMSTKTKIGIGLAIGLAGIVLGGYTSDGIGSGDEENQVYSNQNTDIMNEKKPKADFNGTSFRDKGVHIKVSGRAAGNIPRTDFSSLVSRAITNSVQSNINVTTRDDSSKVDRQWVESQFLKTLKGR